MNGGKGRGVMLLMAAAVGLNGCAAVLVGAGAVGGYAVSRDNVVGQLEQSKNKIYKEALNVAREMGEIRLEDPVRGLIRLTIQETRVQILIRRLTERTVELRVKARNKYWMPKVQVAQEVYTKILREF